MTTAFKRILVVFSGLIAGAFVLAIYQKRGQGNSGSHPASAELNLTDSSHSTPAAVPLSNRDDTLSGHTDGFPSQLPELVACLSNAHPAALELANLLTEAGYPDAVVRREFPMVYASLVRARQREDMAAEWIKRSSSTEAANKMESLEGSESAAQIERAAGMVIPVDHESARSLRAEALQLIGAPVKMSEEELLRRFQSIRPRGPLPEASIKALGQTSR